MRVAILTDFASRNPVYSLTHVVDSQVQMLLRYGHEPVVFVREDFSDPGAYPEMSRVVPAFIPQDYASESAISNEHQIIAHRLAEILPMALAGFDVVFTHDWIHTAFKLPLAIALRECAKQARHIPFFHWIHSRPAGNVKTQQYCDWWDIHRYGPNHKIVGLNHADKILVADAFRGNESDIRVIPNIKDIRVLHRWGQAAWDFVDVYPGLMQAGFVQIYPAAWDRLSDKGIKHLIGVFAAIKRRGWQVSLVIANGWTGLREREDINRYKALAQRVGLVPDCDVIFTSDHPSFENGVPHDTLMDLMICGNLFIFPSRAECDPLIAAEAVAMGGALLVLNRSLPVMQEIGRNTALYFDFGSNDRQYDCSGDYQWMADKIIAAFLGTNHARTLVRRSLNMDTIYERFYAPILAECQEQSMATTPTMETGKAG